MNGQLRAWLDGLAALGGVVSAVEAIVATPDEIRFRHASGFRVGGERLVAAAGARFDAASLTKPWAATLALVLDRREANEVLALKERTKGDEAPRPEDLLRHRAGLPAWLPLEVRLGKRLGDRRALVDLLLTQNPAGGLRSSTTAAEGQSSFNGSLSPLPSSPSQSDAGAADGRSALYSDLDYLLWGLLVEEGLGEPWTSALDRLVCAPLGVAPLGSLAREPQLAVECRLDNGKEVELAAGLGVTLQRQRPFLSGVVQDGNARALRAAGVEPAHAGLFVTADEMLALGREWLRPEKLLTTSQVDAALAGGGPYALGWARWSQDGSSGPALSRSSYGHTGFTGGSLWIDPERESVFVLMAHRLSSAIEFNPFRREFHRLAGAVGG